MSLKVIQLAGRLGMARIGVLTILPEEFTAVQTAFGALRNISGTPYFVHANTDVQGMKFDVAFPALAVQPL